MDRIRPYLQRIFIGVAVALVFLLVADLNSRIVEHNRISRDHANSIMQSTALYQEYQVQQTQEAYVTSEASVHEWAYREGRYINPSRQEVLVVVLPEDEIFVSPTPTPQETLPEVSKWEIWQALFFDQTP